MHDVKLVLFAIAGILTALTRVATPRNRRTRKNHDLRVLKIERMRLKDELCTCACHAS